MGNGSSSSEEPVCARCRAQKPCAESGPYSGMCEDCARLAHKQAEEELQDQRSLNDVERLKRLAELERRKKEAELELLAREREDEREDIRKRIELDYEKRVKEIEAEAKAKQAEYEAAKNEDDIKRRELERNFQHNTQELKVAKEKQMQELERKEREQDLETKKQKEDLELEVTKAREDQARKHTDDDHVLDQELRKEDQQFKQDMERFTQVKKLAIEENFARKMVLDAEVDTGSGKKGRLRASGDCPADLLSVLVGAMKGPALDAPPQPKMLEQQESEAPLQKEKMVSEDDMKPDPSTGAQNVLDN